MTMWDESKEPAQKASQATTTIRTTSGQIQIKAGRLNEGLKVEWFDPRSGKGTPAQGQRGRTSRTPDEQDWVLLFQRGHSVRSPKDLPLFT